MGYDGEEGCVDDSHNPVLVRVPHSSDYALASLDHTHNLGPRGAVKMESYEHHGSSTEETGSENDDGNGLAVISQLHHHDNHSDHVIHRWISHPSHFGHWQLDSGTEFASA